MKRLTAALAAALIVLSVSTPAAALPEDNSGETSSPSSSNNEESREMYSESISEDTEETSEEITNEDSQQNSDSEITQNNESKNESSVVSENSTEKKLETSPMNKYFIDSIDMSMGIPANMYVLSVGMDENSPALAACKTTKAEVEKSFKESDTYIKASAKDFSYDITVTLLQNENTKTIGNLSHLSDQDVEKVVADLLNQEVYTGCSKNKYNNTVFLTLEMEYKSGNTKVCGIQQYTVVNDTRVVITFQFYNEKLTKSQRDFINEVMNNVVFKTSDIAPVTSNVSETNVQNLDPRYICIMAASVIGIAALAGIIISASKYKLSKKKLAEEENIEKDNIEKVSPQEDKTEYDNSYFKPINEDVIYEDKSVREQREKREQTRIVPRLDTKSELEIPENPYTPVGKAEAVVQPPMSITSEFTKLTVNTLTMEAVNSDTADTDEDDDEVVFAEGSPKQKTEIEQISESVLSDKKGVPSKNEELSPYERRFGRSRQNINPPDNNSSKLKKNIPEKSENLTEKSVNKNSDTVNTLTFENIDKEDIPSVNTLTFENVDKYDYSEPVNTLTFDDISKEDDSQPVTNSLTFDDVNKEDESQPVINSLTFDDINKEDDSQPVTNSLTFESISENKVNESVNSLTVENVVKEEIKENSDAEKTKETLTNKKTVILTKENKNEKEEKNISENEKIGNENLKNDKTINNNIDFGDIAGEIKETLPEKNDEPKTSEPSQKENTPPIGTPIAVSSAANAPVSQVKEAPKNQSFFDKLRERLFSYEEEDINLDDDKEDEKIYEEEQNGNVWSKIKSHLKNYGDEFDEEEVMVENTESDETNKNIPSELISSDIPETVSNEKLVEENADIKKTDKENISEKPIINTSEDIQNPPVNLNSQFETDSSSKYEKLFGHKNTTETQFIINTPSKNSDNVNMSAFERKFGKLSPVPTQDIKKDSDEIRISEENISKSETEKSENETKPSEENISKSETKKSENETKPSEENISKSETEKSENETKPSEENISKSETEKSENETKTSEENISKFETEKSENEIKTSEENIYKSETEKSENETKTSEENISKSETEKSENENKISKENTVKSEPKKTDETKNNDEMRADDMSGKNRNQFLFERDSNIKFEHAIKSNIEIKGTVTPLTAIPRLESVKADEYNSMIDNVIRSQQAEKSQPVSKPQIQPKPPVTPVQQQSTAKTATAKASTTAAQPAPQSPKTAVNNNNTENSSIEYYKGYDPNEDPFANEKYQTEEMLIKEQQKSLKNDTISNKLKNSFAKLFSTNEDDQN